MDSHYHLPFRPSDTRTSSAWSAQSQAPYAIVSSDQHLQIQSQHPKHDYQQNSPQRQQGSTPTQQHGPFYYGQYQGNAVPVALSYNAPHSLPYGQSLPLVAAQAVMSPSGSKLLPSLPLPSQILPSQNPNLGPCLACGKNVCTLSSHRHFSKYVMTNARKRGVSNSQTSTPRIFQSSLAVQAQIRSPPVESMSVSPDLQREDFLGLWSKDWGPTKHGPERHLFPQKFIDRVLPAAQAHPPLFQALLAYSGIMWGIANRVIDVIATSQQAFAVELLSQACPTENEASTDEGILAATVHLLIYLAQGNGFEVGKHVSGLVHLTKLRGGPYYLGLSGLVAETLLYADHMQAIFFNHQPIWQLPLPPLEMGLPQRLGHGFQQVITRHEIDLPLALAARSVCKVADIFEMASHGEELPREVKNGFSYLSTIAEYQLAQCNAVYNQTGDTNECICLSLILFNHVILRNDGAITSSILQVEHRFWRALDAADSKGSTIAVLPCLYMWMVMNGLLLSIRGESQYRNHGIGRLRTARISAGINTWEQLRRNVLDDFLWLAEAQEETFQRIWAEVEGVKVTFSAPGIVSGQTGAVLPPAG